MSYQLTADQWRIVLLVSKNGERRRLTPPMLAEELGLGPECLALDLYKLKTLKILTQDAAYQLFPGEAWPSDDELSLMFVWLSTTESPDTPEDIHVASALKSMSLKRLTRRGEGYFLSPAQEALKGAMEADDPISYLEGLASAPALDSIDLVRKMAREEVLRYWRIRPISDEDDRFDFRGLEGLSESGPEWPIAGEEIPPVDVEPAPFEKSPDLVFEDPGPEEVPLEVLAEYEPSSDDE